MFLIVVTRRRLTWISKIPVINFGSRALGIFTVTLAGKVNSNRLTMKDKSCFNIQYSNSPLLVLMVCIMAVLSSCATLLGQSQHSSKLQPVAAFGKSMAIGLSVNTNNRVFVSFPNYNGDGKYALAEVIQGKLRAYPDLSWNKKYPVQENGIQDSSHFLRIQDLYCDSQDFLWVLDSKPAPAGDIFKSGTSKRKRGIFALIKINTTTNKVERVYDFPDLNKSVSALNDVRVDPDKQVAYLSDPGQAALVILDLVTGRSRTVLSRSGFTLADKITLAYDGQKMVDQKGHPFSSNVNGIAMTHDGKYLYFKPINKENLFRIETRFLRDTALTEQELASKVEIAGRVGITHGLIADKAGNIYLTTSEGYSISYLTPEGQLKVLVKDKNLLWPDSMGIGRDGYLYISCSQLQRLPTWNHGQDRTEYPYKAYRVKLPLN